MKIEDAKKVIEILLKCDGGCEYCVSNLLNLFRETFPEYRSLAETVFKNEFGKELEDFLNQPHKEHR